MCFFLAVLWGEGFREMFESCAWFEVMGVERRRWVKPRSLIWSMAVM